MRCWCFLGIPRRTTVEKVKKDLSGWKLSRCVWVMDRGMNSEQNRAVLQQAGAITFSARSCAITRLHRKRLLSRPFHKVAILCVEVWRPRGRRRRFVLVYNPSRPRKTRREATVAEIKLLALGGPEKISRRLSEASSLEMAYLRQLKSGSSRSSDPVGGRALHGKYLLSTSDDSLSGRCALGYSSFWKWSELSALSNLWILKFLLKNSELGNPPQKSPPNPPLQRGAGGISGKASQVGFFGCGSAALCTLWFIL